MSTPAAFLVTAPAAPLEDDVLDAALQAAVVGITGLPGAMVRPLWQNPPPKQPDPSVNWCAIGVLDFDPDDNPFIEHIAGPLVTDPSADLEIRHEEMRVLAAFYGPQAGWYSAVLRDGLGIPQNLEPLKSQGIYYTGKRSSRRVVPELLNKQWVRRVDTEYSFRRMVTRAYGVNNVLVADVQVQDDSGHVEATVIAPPGANIIP